MTILYNNQLLLNILILYNMY